MKYQELIDGLLLAREQEEIKETLKQVQNYRYHPETRNSIPFSSRLNEWIRKRGIEITRECKALFVKTDDFEDSDPEGTFKRHQESFNKNKTIQIWKGASEISIFADEEVNWLARLWHDYTHLTNGLGYDVISELIVGKIQASQLPEDWWYEKALIDAEVTGQILYHQQYGEFPKDQRKFTLDYLNGGLPPKQ